MKRLLSVVGARPNFMKVAPIVEELKRHPGVEHCLVHSGQHYDELLSGNFFADLGLPKPDVNLQVGSGSHAVQTAEIMRRIEPVLLDYKPEMVVVVLRWLPRLRPSNWGFEWPTSKPGCAASI